MEYPNIDSAIRMLSLGLPSVLFVYGLSWFRDAHRSLKEMHKNSIEELQKEREGSRRLREEFEKLRADREQDVRRHHQDMDETRGLHNAKVQGLLDEHAHLMRDLRDTIVITFQPILLKCDFNFLDGDMKGVLERLARLKMNMIGTIPDPPSPGGGTSASSGIAMSAQGVHLESHAEPHAEQLKLEPKNVNR